MIIQLMDEYIPKEVLHRQEEINEIRQIFSNFEKLGMGSNTAILGVTGSGKTTIIKTVREEFRDSCMYINCAETQTPFKTLQAICQKKVKTQSAVLQACIEYIRESPKILILDELDKVGNLVKLMNDINTIYRKTGIPIIVVTLKRNLIESMPSDVKKTLLFDKITLRAYNQPELKDIFKSRLRDISVQLPEFDEGTINFICAMSARQGSARVLLNIMLKCIQKNDYSQDYISEIYEASVREDWVSFVGSINDTQKRFLWSLIEVCDAQREASAETLERMMKNLTGARISQLINEFEKYNVTKSRLENLGRAGGRRRLVRFTCKETYDDIVGALGA